MAVLSTSVQLHSNTEYCEGENQSPLVFEFKNEKKGYSLLVMMIKKLTLLALDNACSL